VEMTGGTILGCFEEFSFVSRKMNILPGHTIFLYTDGVTEAFNAAGQAYEEHRLEKQLLSGNGDLTKLIRLVVEDVSRFSTGISQSDDITMLGITYRG